MTSHVSLIGLGALVICAAACSKGSSPSVGGAAGAGAAGAAGTTTGAAGAAGATSTAGAGGGSGGAGGAAGAALTQDAGAAGAALDAATDGGASDADARATASIKGHPDDATTYPTYPGFTLYLVEEFNAPLDLDKDPIWTWGDGTIDSGLVRFGEDAITFADGKMKITVTEGDTPMGFSVATNDDVPARTLESGEVRSKYNMFRWGRYEASIKAATNESNFVLSMFTFRTPAPEEWREIDVELVANLPTSYSTNVIIGENMTGFVSSSQEPATTFPFGAQPAMALPAGYNSQTAFHTYAFEALPDHITYFVDGVPVRTKETGIGANDLIVPERSMKAMFNHWVFNGTGFGGGDPQKNTYPMTGVYDWFRFYKWDQDPDYPCEPLPGCLPADDTDLSANNPKESP